MDEIHDEPSDPPWLQKAQRQLGCKELVEGSLNPVVRGFFDITGYPKNMVNKRTAWCAAFACTMLEKGGYRSPRSAAARSFLTYGREIVKPKRGAILVFTRGPADANTGHVGFYVGETQNEFLVLGGNQGNCVSVQRYPKERLVAVRWPTDRLKPAKVQPPPPPDGPPPDDSA